MSNELVVAFSNPAYSAVYNSAELTRLYAYKNWVTVKLAVSSDHSFKRLGGSEVPIAVSSYFRREHSIRPINIFKNSEGTIAFSIVISYAYYYEGGVTHKANTVSSGSVQHRCSFDYIFPPNANGPADLTIGKIVKTRGDDGVMYGDSTYSVELAEWNDDKGVPNGPRYVRINPSVKYSTGSERSPQTTDDEGMGAFVVPIHISDGAVIFDGPNRGVTITPINV
jgi:hypothetical protein